MCEVEVSGSTKLLLRGVTIAVLVAPGAQVALGWRYVVGMCAGFVLILVFVKWLP